MRKMISRIATYCTAAAFVLVSASSCQKDGAEGSVPGRGHRIGVSLAAVDETKGSADDGMLPERFDGFYLGQVEGDSLFVEACVQENGLLPFEGERTKGSVATTASVQTASAFMMGGWLGSENRYTTGMPSEGFETSDATDYNFIRMQKVVYDSGKGKWNWASGSYQWRNSVPSTFWSYYPETAAGRTLTFPSSTATDAQQKVVTMGYTLPTGTTDAAARQQDLLLAYNCQKWTGRDSRTSVDVKFRHALAAVRFQIDGALKSGVTVTNIGLEGIAASGTCTATADASGALSFAWTPGEGKAAVGQSYQASDFTEKSLDGETDNALMALTSSKFFFLVPQAIKGSGVKLCLTYTRADGTVSTVKTDLDHDKAWEAGKIYTYIISVAGDKVDVSVDDRVSGNVKDNLAITNTGNCKAFIRAAVIANWFDADGNIVASWSEGDTASGTFTGLAGTGWEKGDDGFYYYKTAVEAGAATSALFTRYERRTAEGRHLEMKVMAQAIKYDSNKTYRTVWSY